MLVTNPLFTGTTPNISPTNQNAAFVDTLMVETLVRFTPKPEGRSVIRFPPASPAGVCSVYAYHTPIHTVRLQCVDGVGLLEGNGDRNRACGMHPHTMWSVPMLPRG